MENYLIGIAIITSIMVAWIAVQRLWSLVFSDEITDPDVLAGRSDCGSCGCKTPCSTKQLQTNKKIN
ncbi:hypothetical protein [Ekhidna sp.]|uniref:hypothetical protein n=1 Tax=Ekhidna sp. TaxID=2608089 RepID=UPI003B5064D9